MNVSDIYYFFWLGEGKGSPRRQEGGEGFVFFNTGNPRGGSLRTGGGGGLGIWRGGWGCDPGNSLEPP